MPREKTKFKLRCCEVSCNAIVRSDKWTDHCRKHHAFKFIRNLPIKYKTIEYQHFGGSWKPFTESVNDQPCDNALTVTPSSSSVSSLTDINGKYAGHPLPVSPAMSPLTDTNNNVQDSVIEVTDLNVEPSPPDDIAVPSKTITDNDLTATGTSFSTHKALEADDQAMDSVSLCVSESNDPALFADKRITPAVISFLINSPCQPDKDNSFVKTNGRSFLCDWFRIVQPDKTCRNRAWLSYSMSTHSAFCTTCLLFGGPTADNVWTCQGYTGWQSGHGLRGIERHESSVSHRQTELIRYQWIHDKRVDKGLTAGNKLLVEKYRRVVYIAVKTIKFLATEMIAVLGHTNRDGKFMHLFREFSELDPCAAGYLEQLDGIRQKEIRRKPDVNLLSSLNCRRLLQTMKSLVVREICSEVSQQKTFSLINDGTQDLSKKDAQAVLVRYVSNKNGIIQPVERLIEVFTTGDSSGQGLCDRVVPILRELKLDFDWIIGQSYDGASNMRGRYSGLQAKMRELGKKALYVWCQAHRLNLVVEGVLKSSPQVMGTIGLLQELYNFFNGYKRQVALTSAQAEEQRVKTLKRVSETTRSWRSVEDGVNVILDRYDGVVSALQELSNSRSSDAATITGAVGLLRRLQDFDTIVTVSMLRSIFRITGPVSRMLQGVACDYGVAASLLQDCISKFNEMRDKVDEYWSKLITQAKEFATEHDIEPGFPEKRQRRTKRMPGEVVRDERVQDPEQSFKVDTFIPAVVSVQSEFKDRFTDLTIDIMHEMQFFSPHFLLSDKPDIDAVSIETICTFYEMDAINIARELVEFRPVFRQLHTVTSLDDLMSSDSSSRCTTQTIDSDNNSDDGGDSEHVAGLERNQMNRWADRGFLKPLRMLVELSGFPALNVMYKILVSLAITSSSAERAMSRVRLIKNRLRTTMLDDWFSSLMILASEKDILDSIPVDRIIDLFATCSVPLQKMLLM